MSCFEAQKELFLSLKNSFLEAVAGSENNLKHCKNQRTSLFLRLTNSLKNGCFWFSERDVFKSQKSFKKSHFLVFVLAWGPFQKQLFLTYLLALFKLRFNYLLVMTKSRTRLKHCKHQRKCSFFAARKKLCLIFKNNTFWDRVWDSEKLDVRWFLQGFELSWRILNINK